MTTNFEETLISVWRQALVEDCKTVTLEGVHYPVRPTSRSKPREVKRCHSAVGCSDRT
jgi:hypothetical protein